MPACFEVLVADSEGRTIGAVVYRWNGWAVSHLVDQAHCFKSRRTAQQAVDTIVGGVKTTGYQFCIQDIEPDEAELEALAI